MPRFMLARSAAVEAWTAEGSVSTKPCKSMCLADLSSTWVFPLHLLGVISAWCPFSGLRCLASVFTAAGRVESACVNGLAKAPRLSWNSPAPLGGVGRLLVVGLKLALVGL